ncbi:MAG: glycosyltransferase [Planctomycetes bacterium]|nr:glycosyltransferase [Planctomycetota bacterium]
MRLALVTQLDPSEFLGGTELVVRAQLRALVERGHEVWLVAGTQRPSTGAATVEGSQDGIRVVRVPRLPHEVYDLEILRPRIAHLVADAVRGADVVHVHHWFTLTSNLVRVLAAQVPVVVSLHDAFATCPRFFRCAPEPAIACPPPGAFTACARCVAPDAPGNAPAELERRLAARAAAFTAEVAAAAAVVAPSRAHAALVAPYLGLVSPRIQVIPHGLCRALVRPERAPARPGAPPVVLHFGNLGRGKGTLDLVRSLARLAPGSIELHLLGPALDPELHHAIERERGALAITRGGAYGERELEAAAARATLAAFPSRLAESYGLVVDESLALGLPTWVSDRGALGERLGGAGRILPAEDVAAWTDAFEALLSRPSMLDAARLALPNSPRRAADAAAELEALYQRVAREPRR